MGIQELKNENILLVNLVPEGDTGAASEEISAVIEMVRSRGGCDIMIDFSGVDILTCDSLSRLLKLRKLLADSDCRLIFFNIHPTTRGIFTVTGIEGCFQFADDKNEALAILNPQPIKVDILEGENISIAHLVPGRCVGDQIKSLIEWLGDRNVYDLIIDFSNVDAMDKNDLTSLVRLDEFLSGSNHRPVLFNVSASIKEFFFKNGVDDVFEIAEDRNEALETLLGPQFLQQRNQE